MDDDFVKKRLERDLADLKRMCDDHFKKRKDDDAVVTDLEKRIADRQTVSRFYLVKRVTHCIQFELQTLKYFLCTPFFHSEFFVTNH